MNFHKIQNLKAHSVRASWALVEQLVSPIIMFSLTPFFIKQFGLEQYGLWALVMTVVGFGQLISLGAGSATIKYVSADFAVGRMDKAVLTIRAALTVITSLGGAACILMAILAPSIAKDLFPKMGSSDIVGTMIVFAAILMFLQEIDNVFSSALRGAQCFELCAKVELVTRLIWALSIVILVWYFKNITAVIIGTIFLSIIKVGIKAHFVKQTFFTSDCYKLIFDRVQLKRVLDFGKWTWTQGVGGILLSTMDRFLIGSIFGSGDLARYSICVQLAQYAHTIPAAGMQIIFPLLSAKIERGVSIHSINLFKHALYLGALCLIFPLVLIISLPYIIQAWIGIEFYTENQALLLVSIISYALIAVSVPAHFLLMGLGRVQLIAFVNLMAGVLVTSASLLLSPLGLIWFVSSKLIYGPILFLYFIKLKNYHG